MRAIETKYKGYRFRSRLEARWAVFFDTLGIQWWYEYEGFELSFDVDEFDPEEDLLVGDERRWFVEDLEFAKGRYLPDFYLPELNYWIEIKLVEPSAKEKEKAFLLSSALHDVASKNLKEAYTKFEKYLQRYIGTRIIDIAWERLIRSSVYIFYGDIPWPYPTEGNAIGYGTGEVGRYRLKEEVEIVQEEYWGYRGMCWQQCRLCSRIGIRTLGTTYCQRCRFQLENQIYKLTDSRGMDEQDIDRDLSTDIRNQHWVSMREDMLEDQTPLEEEDPEYRRRAQDAIDIVNELAERGKEARDALEKHDKIVGEVLNLEFFRTSHQTPDLQKAYDAARSARFEGTRGHLR